jgi:hypothetical protein
MGRDVFGDTRPVGGLPAGFRRHLRVDGDIGPAVVHGAGEQIGLGFHPAPIDAQGLQQFLTQRISGSFRCRLGIGIFI